MRTIEWDSGTVRMIDQRLLPHEYVELAYSDYRDVARAIKEMQIRGAPAIGAAAAYGIALAAVHSHAQDRTRLVEDVRQAADVLQATRPTASNLFWALKRMLARLEDDSLLDVDDMRKALIAEAETLAAEDVAANRQMGQYGAELIEDGDNILTHCNAGALATVDYGTALAPIRTAWEQGKRVHVFVDETRPRLQGARLTAWELMRDGIPMTLIADNAAGYFLQKGVVDLVFVGADRVVANGDVVNKIGTYKLAVVASENGVPFYPVVPTSTIDLSIASGDQVPIEERDAEEVTHIQGQSIAPIGVKVAVGVMGRFRPELLPIHVGSLPHEDAQQACAAIRVSFPELPGWPQLPKRGFRENMYVQFSEGFPGLVIEGEGIFVDRTRDLFADLERLYQAYLEEDLESYGLGASYAAGFEEWCRGEYPDCRAVKGQVTGPVSWGLTVVDQDLRPVLYDEVLADGVGKHLRLKAMWQERELRRLCPMTIMFLDEPYMASFGSAYVSLAREQVVRLWDEVLGGLQGWKGIHCCGNTDWSLVLSVPLDILSFDTYDYAESLSLYAAEVKDFLARGGCIAWGIVPRDNDKLAVETPQSLVRRLLEAMDLLVQKGIALDSLLSASLISPCCGLGSLSVEDSERVLELTAVVSREMRRRYLP